MAMLTVYLLLLLETRRGVEERPALTLVTRPSLVAGILNGLKTRGFKSVSGLDNTLKKMVVFLGL